MQLQSHIFLIEDEPDLQKLVRLHLERNGYRVSCFDKAETALQAMGPGGPDLAVIDWMLPGMSGIQLCRKIQGKFPVVMLTARAESRDIVAGLDAGADDYVTKPFETPVLLARIAAVLRRRGNSATKKAPTLVIGSTVIDEELHSCTCNGNSIALTPMEFRLFSALAASTGKVLTRQKLMDIVQGIGVSVTERTIDQHVFTLRKKLGGDGLLIDTVRGVGYRVGYGGGNN